MPGLQCRTTAGTAVLSVIDPIQIGLFSFLSGEGNVDDGSQARFEATARGSRLGTLAYRRVAYLIHIFNGLHYFVVANMRAERDLICRSIIGLILRTISLVRLSRGMSFSVLILLDEGSSLLLVSGSWSLNAERRDIKIPNSTVSQTKVGTMERHRYYAMDDCAWCVRYFCVSYPEPMTISIQRPCLLQSL